MNATAATSTLSVVGNHLVDNGNTVVLRGVNRSGSEYACWQGWGFFDGPSDDASAAAIAAWGSNAIRVPLNEDCWLGINGVPATYSGANYRAAISGFVTRLRAHGLYVILSNQVAGPGTTMSTTILPMPDADHAPTFWSAVANTFKADKGVIFDLYNEPHDVSWSCWADGCQITGGYNVVTPYLAVGMKSLTTTIRAAGASNVILVPGIGWSYDVTSWLANRPNDGQLIAGIHNYGGPGNNTIADWDSNYAPTALQVPVTMGEIGFDGYIEQIMPWADAHGIGYLAWTWDTWNNEEALISDYNGTPTTYGLGFKNHLAGLPTPTPTPTPTPSPSPTPTPPAGCTAVTQIAAPASSAPSGTPVVFTASAATCPNPRYEFWMRPASQISWQLVQAYGSSATYSWNTRGAAAGVVYFEVWARDASSTAARDTFSSIPYTITAPLPCASVTVSSAPATVAHSTSGGAHVTVTAAAVGCTSPRYEFWLRPASSSTWQLVQAYSPTAAYDWNSTGAAAGLVYLGVHVRDANSPAAYDAVASNAVTVTSPAPCGSVTVSAAPTTVAQSTSGGTHVIVTAAATGCTSPRYEFWLRPASSSTWQLVQTYSATAAYDWNSTGAASGIVYLGVHVRDANSTAGYDVVASTPVTVI